MKLKEYLEPYQSTILGTIGENDYPFGSYAPCYYDGKSIYIYISNITTHAQNINRYPKVSALFIEDEGQSKQIFARKRISLQCDAHLIKRDSVEFDEIMQTFIQKQGKTLSMLLKMEDFNLYQLSIVYGEATFGFGDAYFLGGENMDELIPRDGSRGRYK